jgi:hypothetical protein
MATVKNPVGKAAKHGQELAQRTRKGILNAFDCVETKHKKLLSEVLADAFLENPLKFLDTASKFIPKQVDIDVSHTKTANTMTDDELADIIATRARQRLEAKTIEGDIIEEVEDNQELTG